MCVILKKDTLLPVKSGAASPEGVVVNIVRFHSWLKMGASSLDLKEKIVGVSAVDMSLAWY